MQIEKEINKEMESEDTFNIELVWIVSKSNNLSIYSWQNLLFGVSSFNLHYVNILCDMITESKQFSGTVQLSGCPNLVVQENPIKMTIKYSFQFHGENYKINSEEENQLTIQVKLIHELLLAYIKNYTMNTNINNAREEFRQKLTKKLLNI